MLFIVSEPLYSSVLISNIQYSLSPSLLTHRSPPKNRPVTPSWESCIISIHNFCM
ncbi:unnamed protein product [Prunus brigantina]